MNIKRRISYCLFIGALIIFISISTVFAKDKKRVKVITLVIDGEQEFVVKVVNEEAPKAISPCDADAHWFRINIKKGKKWIKFLKVIEKKESKVMKIKVKKSKKRKPNDIKVPRHKSVNVKFIAYSNIMKWGKTYEGIIEFKCLDCYKGIHKLPEDVKVIASKDERIRRKAWLIDKLNKLAKTGLQYIPYKYYRTGKRKKAKRIQINLITNRLVVVKGSLPGVHGGGGIFIPGGGGIIPKRLEEYRKYIYDWNMKKPKNIKKTDKEYVEELEKINLRHGGCHIIVVSTDASYFNPGSKSLGKIDLEEKVILLLAALHELKHFLHRDRGLAMSIPLDEMEVLYWQLFSNEVRKHLRKYAGKSSIPKNCKRMFLETYFFYWKEAKERDKLKVSYHKKMIKKEVERFNKSLKRGEKKIALPEGY